MRWGIRKRLRASFTEFFELESAGGVVLILATAIALFLANSPWAENFQQLLQTDLSLPGTHLNLLHWINDGLMAIFFLVAGAEIKRELIQGELSTLQKAAMPIAAAIGGMAVPALIYFLFNRGTPFERGWGIPMATDIAFSLGVLALLGSRIPIGLKVFLTALAIVDDLGAILVIAVFYSSSLSWAWLGVAGILLGGMAVANRIGVKALSVYLLTGAGVWLCFLNSGVHPTVAGVLVGLLIPVAFENPKSKIQNPQSKMEPAPATPHSALETPQSTIPKSQSTISEESPIDRLIHFLHPWVAFGIVPIFALANAGVAFSGIGLSSMQQSLPLGIVIGLFLGKPIGIMGFSWLASKLRIGQLPDSVTWNQLAGMGFLAGIGFTMSLFIGELAFSGSESLLLAKFGILIGSLVSAIIGFICLRSCTNERQQLEPMAESN